MTDCQTHTNRLCGGRTDRLSCSCFIIGQVKNSRYFSGEKRQSGKRHRRQKVGAALIEFNLKVVGRNFFGRSSYNNDRNFNLRKKRPGASAVKLFYGRNLQ
jgi:hypothetical protein